jgi:hypothetical protein
MHSRYCHRSTGCVPGYLLACWHVSSFSSVSARKRQTIKWWCELMYSDRSLPTFRRNVQTPSWRSKTSNLSQQTRSSVRCHIRELLLFIWNPWDPQIKRIINSYTLQLWEPTILTYRSLSLSCLIRRQLNWSIVWNNVWISQLFRLRLGLPWNVLFKIIGFLILSYVLRAPPTSFSLFWTH